MSQPDIIEKEPVDRCQSCGSIAETHKSAEWDNGGHSIFSPVATLEDESGGIAHIAVDDHCYILAIKRSNGKFSPTPYIFKEAFGVLKKLPYPK